VRKKPTYQFQGSGSVSAGSWDNYRGEMDISGPLNDDASLRGRVVGVYQNKQSFVDYLHNERNVLYGVLAYDLTPDTVVTTGLNWQKTRSVPDIYGVPFASDKSSLHLPRSTYLGASWNRINFEKINPFVEFEHIFTNDWMLKSALNYTHSRSDGRYISAWGNGTTGVDPAVGTGRLNNNLRYDNKGEQWGYNLSMSGPFALLGCSHELVFGGDYQKENFDNQFGRIANTSTVDIFNWQPNTVAEPDWSNPGLYNSRYNERYNVYQRGLFATTRLELANDWKLILVAVTALIAMTTTMTTTAIAPPASIAACMCAINSCPTLACCGISLTTTPGMSAIRISTSRKANGTAITTFCPPSPASTMKRG
jgi:outer membrane receptor for ferric coprogen and ferric-rhodotorulic acid